jgi:hypothetical protein
MLLVPVLSFAQDGGELLVGEQTVVYDNATTTDVGTPFYQDTNLVASEHQGVTSLYQNDQVTLASPAPPTRKKILLAHSIPSSFLVALALS